MGPAAGRFDGGLPEHHFFWAARNEFPGARVRRGAFVRRPRDVVRRGGAIDAVVVGPESAFSNKMICFKIVRITLFQGVFCTRIPISEPSRRLEDRFYVVLSNFLFKSHFAHKDVFN